MGNKIRGTKVRQRYQIESGGKKSPTAEWVLKGKIRVAPGTIKGEGSQRQTEATFSNRRSKGRQRNYIAPTRKFWLKLTKEK